MSKIEDRLDVPYTTLLYAFYSKFSTTDYWLIQLFITLRKFFKLDICSKLKLKNPMNKMYWNSSDFSRRQNRMQWKIVQKKTCHLWLCSGDSSDDVENAWLSASNWNVTSEWIQFFPVDYRLNFWPHLALIRYHKSNQQLSPALR